MTPLAAWRDRAQLLPLLARWRETAVGRAVHRVATGGSWVELQLAGADRASLFLGALPGAVLAFPYTAPLPYALRAVLPPRRNPLLDLLAAARLREVAVLAGDLVLHLEFDTAHGRRLLRHQLFGSRGNTVVLDPDGRVLWTAHRSPHPGLLDPLAPLAVAAIADGALENSAAAGAGATGGDEELAAWTEAGLDHLARQQEQALGDNLQRRLQRRLAAAERLIANLSADLARADNGAQFRRDAETLAANLHAVPRGADVWTGVDPHDGSERTLALDPAVSPAKNLDRFFRLARKAERGRQLIADRLAATTVDSAALTATAEELARLGSRAADPAVAQPLARLASLLAFQQSHQDQLADAALVSAGPSDRSPDQPARPFRRFVIAGRWEVWVGRNSRENDELTHRASSPRDLWFHAQGVEGSHVVLRTQGKPETVPRRVREQAAALAAAFSKARHSSLVPVLWTERRYVRRPRGAAPGIAVCLRAESLFVAPGVPAGVEPM
ncbi:MAG: NFACT RNA binding domain-containing protein [Candidatus Krumholzibacteria bacterium]|jgi:predicted ribosome quality control (RQC) complex YloA/Tae2 family protein|nr:NFACT RNA binding domain-containing protein [Candidatus Krumholzibacteria bacterium]